MAARRPGRWRRPSPTRLGRWRRPPRRRSSPAANVRAQSTMRATGTRDSPFRDGILRAVMARCGGARLDAEPRAHRCRRPSRGSRGTWPHSRSRSYPAAERARRAREPSATSMVVSNCAWRFSHRRLGIGPAVHGQRDQVRAVVLVTDNRDPWLARSSPERLEAHRPKLASSVRSPEPEPPSGEPTDGAVHQPGGTDEPTSREP